MVGYIVDTKYIGKEKIVVAMDIGTTQSAVSFAYLYPDDYARVRMVNKWPGQAESVGSSKIPTLVAYLGGECKACGSQALDYIDDDNYEVAKWFKLQLHPASMRHPVLPPPYRSSNAPASFEMPALPSEASITKVYTDFMRYLMKNTQISFEDSIPNGTAVWRRLKDTILVVLTTPNGWDLAQQGTLRKAAIAAGLVKKEMAHEFLEFITEGEASVHYALAYSQSKTWLFPGSMFAVVDAGGSTVDSTLYECISTDPKVHLEEVLPSECVQAGGVFVDRAAENMPRKKLRSSRFADDESIADMVTAFETRTKRIYDGHQPSSVLDFGGSRDTDRIRGIIKGKLSLNQQEVGTCFDDAIKRILESCLKLVNGRKYAILVGGFGESPYLKKRLVELLHCQGASVITAEEPSKKAAAEGALIWFIKQTVMARIARTTLGIKVGISYNRWDQEHSKRSSQVYTDLAGEQTLPGGFDILVEKGQKLTADFTNIRSFYQLYDRLPTALRSFSVDVMAWDGVDIPRWSEDEEGNALKQMRRLCTLKADLSNLRECITYKEGPRGRYYRVEHDTTVRFGGTQLIATLQWMEMAIRREGPITIIPNAIL